MVERDFQDEWEDGGETALIENGHRIGAVRKIVIAAVVAYF